MNTNHRIDEIKNRLEELYSLADALESGGTSNASELDEVYDLIERLERKVEALEKTSD